MLRVGITGGIGSGKSYIAQIFSEMGFPVYNADKEAFRLINSDADIHENLVQLLGEEIYAENLALNKSVMADIIFHDKIALQKVNEIVHPKVIMDFDEWCKKQSSKLVFFESAILFEAKLDDFFDYVICITASDDVRIRRVMKRDNTTEEKVRARMANQMDAKKQVSMADFSIDTDDEAKVHQKVKLMADILEVVSLTHIE